MLAIDDRVVTPARTAPASAARQGPFRVDRRGYEEARGGVDLPTFIGRDCRDRGSRKSSASARVSISLKSAATTSRCRRLDRCSIGCVPRCSKGAALCCCAACRLKTGRSPKVPPPIGASAPISAPPVRRTPKAICSDMSTTSDRDSARQTPICAATRQRSGRIFILTAATS